MGRFHFWGTALTILVLRSSAATIPSQSDWATRSTAPGVVTAKRFTQATDVTNYAHGDSLASNVLWNPAGGILGDGCLRIPVLRSHGGNSGAWRIALNPAWTQASDGFGATEFYVQFRCKLGKNRLTPSTDGGGFKFALLGGFDPAAPNSSSAFSGNCIVWTNDNWYGIPWGYRYNGGATQFDDSTTVPGDYRLQPSIDNNPATPRYCLYTDLAGGNKAGCWAFVEEEWFTFKWRIKIPSYNGSAGNELDVWVARDGATSWTQTHANRNFGIGTDAIYSRGPNGLWLTPYDTSRSGSTVDTYHEYDQIIVSTQDIALPTSIVAPLNSSIAAMADKTWITVAGTGKTVSDVLPSSLPSPQGTDTQNGMFTAWDSAAVDTRRKAFRIDAQGGHGDYSGNESYKLLLNVATPAWARVRDPSLTFGTDPVMSDGTPRAAHGQGQVTYAANADKVILTGLPYTAPNGNQWKNFFGIDCSANTWAALTSPGSGYGDNTYFHGGSAYDPYSGMVWAVATTASNNSTTRYNPLTDAQTLYDLYNNRGYDGKAAISPSRRCMIYLNGSQQGHDGTFVWLNIDNPTAAGWVSPTVSGTPPTTEGPGLVWHEPSGAFLAWDSGANLYKLTPPSNLSSGTWAWSSVTPAGGNAVTPSTRQTHGTYGRFALVENLAGRDYLVLVNASNEATYVYKLPALGV